MMRGGGRNMRRMMGKMGMDMSDMPGVREVIIRTDSNEIVITDPGVKKMDTKESVVFMVTTDGYEERELETPSYSEKDVDMITIKTGVDRDTAIAALNEADGELATAILRLQSG